MVNTKRQKRPRKENSGAPSVGMAGIWRGKLWLNQKFLFLIKPLLVMGAVGSFPTPTLLMSILFRVGSFAPFRLAREKKAPSAHQGTSWAFSNKWAQNIPASVGSYPHHGKGGRKEDRLSSARHAIKIK